MVIDSISNGIVIDHITSGKSMVLYRYLNLEKLTCSVAIIKNAPSSKNGKKDIIKIDELIVIDRIPVISSGKVDYALLNDLYHEMKPADV